MIFKLENGQLTTDLDCQFFNLLNVGSLVPTPGGLVSDTDPRLSDPRPPLDGSVSNASVAANAAIAQSKLNLNGVIPPAWLGSGAGQAAAGNLAEYVSRKAQPNGYASLDGAGKVPTSQLPSLAGVGTVTSVGLSLPGHFTVTGSPVTTNGTLTAGWAAAPAYSWFGVQGGTANPPSFHTGPFPAGLIPNLPASIITSGAFSPAQIPLAVYGFSHNQGAVPDPGDATGDPNQYLARDMTYKSRPIPAKVTIITTSGPGSFTPDAGMKALFVELWGGGGGGGGAVTTAGNLAAASGGGGGGYTSKYITTIQSFYNYVIGPGGAGGSAAGGAAQNGGDTTFMGGPPSANGGAAGVSDAVGNVTPGVVRQGGLGGGNAGDFGMAGGDGGDSIRWDGTHGRSGDGGEAAVGGGGAKGRTTDGAGTAGNLFGGGGAGAITTTGTGYAGGAGAPGAIRIVQFF